MISSGIETRTLSTEIIGTRCFESMTTAGPYVDELILLVEDCALPVGAAIITVCGEFGWSDFGVDDSLLEIVGVEPLGVHSGRPCCCQWQSCGEEL